MTVRCLGNVRDVLPAAGAAPNSGAGNQCAASRRGASPHETIDKSDLIGQIGGCVRETGLGVVLVRGPCILNLEHKTWVENMYVASAPVSARYRPVLHQTRQTARSSKLA